jgi:fibronectin type 3 domain-containing protein
MIRWGWKLRPAALGLILVGQSANGLPFGRPAAILADAAVRAGSGQSAPSSSEKGKASALSENHPHSVTLSWKASVPAAPLPEDAVTSYRVYRSGSKKVQQIPANRIECAFVSATSCVDKNVEPGRTYYYVATTVVKKGKYEIESARSKPIKVKVPSP